jgi:hypothetical protein
MEAGGQAYVFKSQLFTDLPRAITAVMTGNTFRSTKDKHKPRGEKGPTIGSRGSRGR